MARPSHGQHFSLAAASRTDYIITIHYRSLLLPTGLTSRLYGYFLGFFTHSVGFSYFGFVHFLLVSVLVMQIIQYESTEKSHIVQLTTCYRYITAFTGKLSNQLEFAVKL